MSEPAINLDDLPAWKFERRMPEPCGVAAHNRFIRYSANTYQHIVR
jgi:hypothetical protein